MQLIDHTINRFRYTSFIRTSTSRRGIFLAPLLVDTLALLYTHPAFLGNCKVMEEEFGTYQPFPWKKCTQMRIWFSNNPYKHYLHILIWVRFFQGNGWYPFSSVHLSQLRELICRSTISQPDLQEHKVLPDGFFRVAAWVRPAANFFAGGGVISGEAIVSHWINKRKYFLGISVYMWLKELSQLHLSLVIFLALLREPSCRINKPARTTVWLRERSLQDSFSWVGGGFKTFKTACTTVWLREPSLDMFGVVQPAQTIVWLRELAWTTTGYNGLVLVRWFIIVGATLSEQCIAVMTQAMDNRLCHRLLFHERGKQYFMQPFLRSMKLLRLSLNFTLQNPYLLVHFSRSARY